MKYLTLACVLAGLAGCKSGASMVAISVPPTTIATPSGTITTSGSVGITVTHVPTAPAPATSTVIDGGVVQ